MSENELPPSSGPSPTYAPPVPGYPPAKRRNPLLLILGLSALFFAFFIVITSTMYFSRSGGSGNGVALGVDSVGVIELKGVITESKKTLKQLERMEDDDRVKAVVLRLDSPGGSVAPSQEIYEAVKAFKKPLVVSMASVAASGAFYVACAAKKVFANPGTITGSIGVIMEFINLEKLYEWAKVKRFSIKTGKFKDAGAEYREMTPEEHALLQGMVDNVLSQFKQAVASGRKLPMDQVTAIADGRIFSGAQAKQIHLVDELGTMQDAINEAAKEAKISGKPHVVYPEVGHRKWWKALLEDQRDDNDDSSEESLSPLGRVIQGVLAEFGFTRAASTARELAPPPGLYWLWGPS